MGVVITIVNQKGGVAKTTTVSALAYILNQKGYRVLSIDLDPQRNLDMLAGKGLAIPINDMETGSILHALNHQRSLHDIIIKTEIGDLARASSQLSGWNGRPILTIDEFQQMQNDLEALADLLRERFAHSDFSHELQALIPEVREEYDFILIDTNPSLTLLTTNGLNAADYVLIPAFPEESSREAVVELWNTIRILKQLNPCKYLEVCGILLTKVNTKTNIFNLYSNAFQRVASSIGTILFNTRIKNSIAASECMSRRQNIMKYQPSSTTAQCYLNFADEFVERIKQMEAKRNG